MTRLALLPAFVFSALAAAAAAAPSFKAAPASESDEGGGWAAYMPIDTEAAPPWLQGVLEFLASNYGYMGVAAVLLMLFLFARGGGGGGKAAAAAGGEDEDFFEPEDVRRYRGGGSR